MPIYDPGAVTRLLDKLDYEIWLLEFLADGDKIFAGGAAPETIKLNNNQMTADISVGFTEHVGASYAQQTVTAISPLVFTASYKVLDMVYEWILEENRAEGVIRTVPWGFKDKIRIISTARLRYPQLFVENAYLGDYSYALFETLLPFRNEVVHMHNFSMRGDELELVNSKNGARLTFDRVKLGHVVRFVVGLAKCLGGTTSFDSTLDHLFKYYLDQLVGVHRLPVFGQSAPLLVNVELTISKQGNTFAADLNRVRQILRRIHPTVHVLFNLTVLAFEGNALAVKWYFPAASVPGTDIEFLSPESHAQFRLQG